MFNVILFMIVHTRVFEIEYNKWVEFLYLTNSIFVSIYIFALGTSTHGDLLGILNKTCSLKRSICFVGEKNM